MVASNFHLCDGVKWVLDERCDRSGTQMGIRTPFMIGCLVSLSNDRPQLFHSRSLPSTICQQIIDVSTELPLGPSRLELENFPLRNSHTFGPVTNDRCGSRPISVIAVLAITLIVLSPEQLQQTLLQIFKTAVVYIRQ